MKPSMISTKNLNFIDSSVSWSSSVLFLADGEAWLVVLIGLETILRHAFFFLLFPGHIAAVVCFV